MRRARRGQSLVEFALFVSVLLTLLTGLLNLGSLLNAHLNVTYAARQAALSAASAGSASLADCMALAAAAVALGDSPDAHVQRIIVYQAAADGAPVGGAGNTSYADVYVGNPGCSDALNPPTPTVANWLPSARSNALYGTITLGVEIDYTYTWGTSLFPLPPLDVSDRAVMPLGLG